MSTKFYIFDPRGIHVAYCFTNVGPWFQNLDDPNLSRYPTYGIDRSEAKQLRFATTDQLETISVSSPRISNRSKI